tara:strand:+ start:1219 stop:1428 length:210 start_codon:yes stop_codon:yes gene_type:complete
MAYCIEVRNGDAWELKNQAHSKLTEEKANARRTQLIDEGEHVADDVRVVEDTTDASPLDPDIEGNTWTD